MKNKLIISLGIIALGAIARLLPHPANFAPIGALALFGGAHFKGAKSFLIPFLAMLVSDFFLGFHDTMSYVYGSFLIIIFLGKLLQKRTTFFRIFAASITSSVLFFLITNFGVWAQGSMYAKDFNGLMTSYAMGIPFFRNTLLGDLFYTASFFYGYHFATLWTKKLLFAKRETSTKSR